MFALLADKQIREKTKNSYGIGKALRGVVKAGYSMQSDDVWPLSKILKIADKSAGTSVLMDLYNEMKGKPVDVDLQIIWKKFGVKLERNQIIFDDSASQVAMRKAIMFGSN